MHIVNCVVTSPTNLHQGLENSELHSFGTGYGPVVGSYDQHNKLFSFHKMQKEFIH